MSKKTRRMLDSLTIKEICKCAFEAACNCEASEEMFIRIFGEQVRRIYLRKQESSPNGGVQKCS